MGWSGGIGRGQRGRGGIRIGRSHRDKAWAAGSAGAEGLRRISGIEQGWQDWDGAAILCGGLGTEKAARLGRISGVGRRRRVGPGQRNGGIGHRWGGGGMPYRKLIIVMRRCRRRTSTAARYSSFSTCHTCNPSSAPLTAGHPPPASVQKEQPPPLFYRSRSF